MIPKQKPLRDRKYLEHLKTQPCIFTGQRGSDYDAIDPMHIGTAGKSLKSGDDETLPVLHSLHVEAHQKGEISMLRKHAPDSLLRLMARAYARELYRQQQGGE